MPKVNWADMSQPVTLVTGASGFLGKSFLREAQKTGESLLCLTHTRESEVYDNVQTVGLGDYLKHSEAMNVTKIVHLATDYGRNTKSLMSVVGANIELPLRLIENHIDTLRHFVNIDSYFTKPVAIQDYLWEYSLSKRQLLEWLKRLSTSFSTSNVVLEHLYGPGDSPEKFAPWITASMIQSKDIALSDGTQLRDWIYVTDAARALALIASQPLDSLGQGVSEYGLGSGAALSVRRFAEEVAAATRTKSNITFDSKLNRPSEPSRSIADISRLTRLGWRPSTTLQSGIQALVEFERKRTS
jgi:CDP-paratose synthetase